MTKLDLTDDLLESLRGLSTALILLDSGSPIKPHTMAHRWIREAVDLLARAIGNAEIRKAREEN